MFSSPTPAPGSRAIASNALRNAGLIDRDAQMRDLTDKQGGRKGSSKIRSHKSRAVDAFRDQTSGSGSSRMLASRMSSHAGPSDPLSIRGASRPTAVGRLRRNAVSANNGGGSGAAVANPSSRAPTATYKTVESWREFVQKRWNPETRFLNLESMIDDEVVKKYNLVPPGYGGSARDAAVIFKLASRLTPEVQSLSLANNNLTGAHLAHLNHYLPRLVNLSLQNNDIRIWRDLDFMSPRKERMVFLRELILLGNPIREQELQNGRGDRYKGEMARRFLSLEMLDQEPVTRVSFDVPQLPSSTASIQQPSAKTFPCEMGPSFITGVDGTIVSNFLIRFFNKFDTQRSALLDAYDTSATFSFSANTSIAARARLQGYHSSRDMPNQRKLEWKPWLNGGAGGSRNLSRIGGGLEKTVNSLHIGGEQTIKAIADLPGTMHDIGGPPEKFCVDSFPVVHGQGMGLLLAIHGQFTEAGTEGVRSFDRTFVLAPAPEGSRAKNDGWDVVILSDQWIIRGYSNHEAWKPGPMLVQAQSRSQQRQGISLTAQPVARQQQSKMPSLPADQQAALAAVPDLQRPLVLQICERTGLNVKFAVDCLTGNGWDLDRAVANFNEVKGTLSREAFL